MFIICRILQQICHQLFLEAPKCKFKFNQGPIGHINPRIRPLKVPHDPCTNASSACLNPVKFCSGSTPVEYLADLGESKARTFSIS